MWQKFTREARKVIFVAQEEAAKHSDTHVSTEDLLLGLTKNENTVAAKALDRFGISLSTLKDTVKARITPGTGMLGAAMQLSPRAKKVIDLAFDESTLLENNYIGTEHILLALIREREGLGGQILIGFGLELNKTREAVKQIQEESAKPIEFRHDSVMDVNHIEALRGRSITSILDLSNKEVELVLAVTSLLKETGKEDKTAHKSVLPSRTLAMIFEKPSLRTRVTFETGMTQLGGHAIYLAPSDIQLGVRETVPDVAKNLSRWCNVIMARVFSHDTILELAKNATIPVINALCDREHPCQALADFQTIKEKKGTLKGLNLVFIGDGNNVANSLMLLAAKVGTHFTIACPKGYEPLADIVETAKRLAVETGSKIEVTNDPNAAVAGADVIYTDVWASMGQEEETAKRAKDFAAFQVNQELVSKADPEAIVMHCLPAHRGAEITSDVLDGPQSVVLDEAENRLHAQKALLSLVVE